MTGEIILRALRRVVPAVMAVLVVGIPWLTARVGVLTALGWWLESTGEVFQRLARML